MKISLHLNRVSEFAEKSLELPQVSLIQECTKRVLYPVLTGKSLTKHTFEEIGYLSLIFKHCIRAIERIVAIDMLLKTPHEEETLNKRDLKQLKDSFLSRMIPDILKSKSDPLLSRYTVQEQEEECRTFFPMPRPSLYWKRGRERKKRNREERERDKREEREDDPY